MNALRPVRKSHVFKFSQYTETDITVDPLIVLRCDDRVFRFVSLSNNSTPLMSLTHLCRPRWLGCAVRLETGGHRFNPRRGRQHSFVEIDHEIFSTVILSLPLIQEGQLSVSGERMCAILVNRLED